METADVVVIGGGVMGTSIAFNLARRRAGRVVLLEKATVCSGTSAKSSAIVRTHYTTRPTAQMALLARGIFERWADEVGGESGFVRTGMLFVGPPESRDRVERTLRMNQEVGIEASLIGPDEVRHISPHLRIPEGAAVVWEPRSGYGSPHEVASSFARRFTELGGELRQSTPVTGIDTHGGRVRAVRTPRGDIAAGHVVIAAGPWAAPVGRLAGLDLPVTPSRESIVTLRPTFDWSPFHPVTGDLANEVYLRPETGGLILVGSTRDTIVPGDPDALRGPPGRRAHDRGGDPTRPPHARRRQRGHHGRLVGDVRGQPGLEPDHGHRRRRRRPPLRRRASRATVSSSPRWWGS